MPSAFRTRAGLFAAGLAAAVMVMAAPTPAEPVAKFEASIAAPAHDAGPRLFAGACPGPGDADGLTYAFFDLKGEYKHLKTYGPAHLFNEPDPGTGYHDINDYDIDMYAFDAKCRDITPSGANGSAGTERFETKRPARYVVVAYWSGIHADLPVTVEAAHNSLK